MILVNGIANEKVSALDRGLAFGDGLFETIAVVGRDVLNWPQHAARLAHGCDRLAITTPDFDELFEEARIVAAGFDRSVVKIMVTRGAGGVGYTPPKAASPTRIVMRRPWPEAYVEREQSGIRVCVARHRLPVQPALAGLKHLNRLDQVIASMELVERGADEALMLDPADWLIEATRCNVFAVFGNRLTTPRLNNCGVAGVMRSIVLQLGPGAGLISEEEDLNLEAVREADEVFLCNAIAGIWPVVELDEDTPQKYPLGAVTRRLQAALIAGGYRR